MVFGRKKQNPASNTSSNEPLNLVCEHGSGAMANLRSSMSRNVGPSAPFALLSVTVDKCVSFTQTNNWLEVKKLSR